ncbi:hypothetical protein LMG3482_03032 [Achromobacter deleyi]|nr:hypothetical protein LMG3481_01864 [Achromobacter deleyi]CAB3875854.1 hypothetical protein LMG3482_03032 [Achromobacter deleyi]
MEEMEQYRTRPNGSSWAVWQAARTRAGKVRAVVSYINFGTGEVRDASSFPRPVDQRDARAKRETVLQGLRPEVRKFAQFLLAFRNQRRGITPGEATLCKWYARCSGKQVGHVRRYLPALRRCGILLSENLVGKLWQQARRRNSHAGEACWSSVTAARFDNGRSKWGADREPSHQVIATKAPPAWEKDAEPTGNFLPYEAYVSLMRRISGKVPERTPHEHALIWGRAIDRELSLAACDTMLSTV